MSDKSVEAGRRDFLKLASVAAVTGGTALAAGGTEAEAAEVKTGDGRYRETDHVRTYYDSAKF